VGGKKGNVFGGEFVYRIRLKKLVTVSCRGGIKEGGGKFETKVISVRPVGPQLRWELGGGHGKR